MYILSLHDVTFRILLSPLFLHKPDILRLIDMFDLANVTLPHQVTLNQLIQIRRSHCSTGVTEWLFEWTQLAMRLQVQESCRLLGTCELALLDHVFDQVVREVSLQVEIQDSLEIG